MRGHSYGSAFCKCNRQAEVGRRSLTRRRQIMTAFRNAVVGTIFLAAAIIVPTTRANADVSIGFSFSAGDVGLALGSLCYEEPVCSYPLYSEPIFVLIPRSHLLSLGKKMSASF